MSLPLTPLTLAAAYDYLRTTPPFKGWNLPESDAIAFTVNRHHANLGAHQGGPTCAIEISAVTVGHTSTLMSTMAHEMLHLAQFLRHEENHAQHNADFRRKAARVCRIHGWDFGLFV